MRWKFHKKGFKFDTDEFKYAQITVSNDTNNIDHNYISYNHLSHFLLHLSGHNTT